MPPPRPDEDREDKEDADEKQDENDPKHDEQEKHRDAEGEEEDGPMCRVCFMGDTVEQPLFTPCRCKVCSEAPAPPAPLHSISSLNFNRVTASQSF